MADRQERGGSMTARESVERERHILILIFVGLTLIFFLG
jgi:hypothetical protein